MADLVQSAQAGILASYPHEEHLSVRLRHRVGKLEIDVDFRLTKPWTILFGPSGSGKTTILRAIAGLVRPDFARIVSNAGPGSAGKNGTAWVDTADGVFSPVHRRGASLAPQRPALFPHLTVRENMTYGCRGVGSTDEQEYVDELIAKLPVVFQIEHVLDKRPAELSGGEAQRVSLARAAMAGHKRILLLDEPFTGLDIVLRDRLVFNILAWQERHSTPILSVTHGVAEAFQLGAEVIKLAEGRVVAQGPVEVVLAEERGRLLSQLNGLAGSRG